MLIDIKKDIDKVINRDKFRLNLISSIIELEEELHKEIDVCLGILESKNRGIIEPYNSYFKGLNKYANISIPFRESVDTHIEYYIDLKESLEGLKAVKLDILNI